MSKSVLFIFPHQLYDAKLLPQVDRVYMIEDPLYFGTDQEFPTTFHKQKLILHRASMTSYVENVLWPAEYKVDYVNFDDVNLQTGHFAILPEDIDVAYMFDPTDDILLKRMQQSAVDAGGRVDLRVLPSPNFYLSYKDAHDYFSSKSDHQFADFYQWQRERFNVLLDDYKPLGGKWIHEKNDHKKLPDDVSPPGFAAFGDNKYVEEAKAYIDKNFPNNFGNSAEFMWPINHDEAMKWLVEFVNERLDDFGNYGQSISQRSPYIFHSLLSSSLNIGLLTPQQVIEEAMKRHERREVPLQSLEGLVRQVLGWREFVRGMYLVNGSNMRGKNNFNVSRRITKDWYNGTTGIEPFDQLVLKTDKHAYAHGSERLVIAGSLMVLSELHPNDIYRWFMERFIDAYDWVMVPNVYGMSQFSDVGGMLDKPYVRSSSYILEISDYAKGDWCDIWDGLYWRFIENHKPAIKNNPQLGKMISQLDHIDKARHRIIGYRAQDFLNDKTKSAVN